MRKGILICWMILLFFLLAILVMAGYHFFYPKEYQQLGNGEYTKIATSKINNPFPIDKNTNIVMEYYYMDDERLLTEQDVKIPALYGCDKDAVISYLENYLKNMSQEEKTEGLISYELMKCQNQQITLRKTYRKHALDGFYAKSFNGSVVIFYGNQKTVYEYTQIMIELLPKDLQDKVNKGYYLENEASLYDFLENYSS